MPTEQPFAATDRLSRPERPLRPERHVSTAMLRGAVNACPACGRSPLYRAYLKVRDVCDGCGEELHHHRADDAPPYFTMLIVGHVVIGGLLAVEQAWAPPSWVQLAIWLPATIILSLLLLPRVKGVLIGLQWALGMHGFESTTDAVRFQHGADAPIPEPHPAGRERRHSASKEPS